MSWLDMMVWNGAYKLFANDSAVIVTELKTYPTGAKEIHGIVAAGDLASVKELIGQAEAWGKEQGCVRASIASREGWLKALPDYRLHQVYIVRDLV